MKHLLIVTNNFPPSKTIGTQRILRICKFLDRTKWKISVLTLKESYYPFPEFDWEDPAYQYLRDVSVYRTNRFDVVGFLINFREFLRAKKSGKIENPTPVKTAPVKSKSSSNSGQGTSSNVGAWQRIKDFVTDMMQFPDSNITWLPIAFLKGRKIIKQEKVDVLFSTSPHHSLHLITSLLKITTGKKLVIDFRDPWARSPWDEKTRSENGFERWKHRRIIGMEKWVLKKADQISLITAEMKQDYIQHHPKVPAAKFKLFNNGFDPDKLHTNGTVSTDNGKKPAKVTFIHAGSLYKERDPTPVLNALKMLKSANRITADDVEFVFMGAITFHLKHIKALTTELGLDDLVTFISKVSYQESIAHMAKSHVLMLLQPVTKVQLPGKFYDYITMDKPILAVAEKDSSVENIIKDRFGIFADIRNVASIAEAISTLIENPHYNIDKIRECRKEFDMSKSITTFENILEVSASQQQ